MNAVRPAWLEKRNRGIHMTIRDVDCEAFDVEAMAKTFLKWHVTYFSFFAAGYVTTYPTSLPLQRPSPWLGERDLTGEIIAAAHKRGIKAIPMIDLGQLPQAAFDAHPEWAAYDPDGQPVRAAHGSNLYRSCPLAGYIRGYSHDMVAELMQRYEIDGIKFGGGSYGFGTEVCHCPACQERYPIDMERPLPTGKDWDDPAWKAYHAWKVRCTAETVRHLVGIVHDLDPAVPVVGNAVCFGDPHWTLNSSLDIEELAEIQDIVQVEVQSRLRYDPLQDTGAWQYLRWPAETARYMTTVSDRPIWTVCSYFMAWPWRRNAVPEAEQTVYLAQMAANGAIPMVNLSGGPPAVHEDHRGFAAIEKVYGFMAANEALYEDTSAANVAIVYSQHSLVHHGDQAGRAYVDAVRGYELALDEAHIPHDIISTRLLDDPDEAELVAARYRVLILPRTTVMSDATATALQRFVAQGGGILAEYDCGVFDTDGITRDTISLADLFGVRLLGSAERAVGDAGEYAQAYMRRVGGHPVVDAARDIALLPLPGSFIPVRAAEDAAVPLRRAAPFRVFPEGWSYTTDKDPGEPMAVAREHEGGGRTVYMAMTLGSSYKLVHHPTLGDLIANAVRWVGKDTLPIEVVAPPTLQIALRRTDDALAVHCVNMTGGERYMREIVPLHNCVIGVRVPEGATLIRATQVSSGQALPVEQQGAMLWATVAELGTYDVILFQP